MPGDVHLICGVADIEACSDLGPLTLVRWSTRAEQPINCLGAEPDHMECVEHGDGVRQAVTDGVVEWDRSGAVSSVSGGPFPRPAPRVMWGAGEVPMV